MAKKLTSILPSEDSSPRHVALAAAVFLTLAALLAYANSWSVPFLLDDIVTIVENPGIRAPASLVAALTPAPHTGVGGRPLAQLSLVLNRLATGDAVQGYHGVNLAIHVLAALALFGVVRRTLLQAAVAPRLRESAALIALAAAGLWLLHPVQTQSVTYISQRTESLMGLCYFFTLYCFVRGVQAGDRAGWFAASVVACLAGMAVKEVMVTAPLMVLLYDYAFVTGSLTAAWRRRWSYYLALGSSWVLLAFLMRGLGGRGVGFGLGLEWWRYLLAGCRAVIGYLSLSIWPCPLVFDHGAGLGAVGGVELLCGLLVGGLGAVALFGLRHAPRSAYLVAWVLVTLAPTSSVVPIPLQPFAENRVYLPLAAIMTGLVVLGFSLGWRRGMIPACLAVALAFGVMTHARNSDYRSEVSIWRDTVAKRPDNPRAHHNLGTVLQTAGKLEEAERHFGEALRLRPDYADARAAIGGVAAQRGRLDEALEHCRAALRLDPDSAAAHNNLGGVLWQKGDLPGAISAYEAALRLRPGLADARANLANVLLGVGRMAEAVAASEAALRVMPGLQSARFSLGCGLSALGRREEAAAAFREIVRIQPDHLDARYNLATTLFQLGRVGEAIPAYQELLRRSPNHASAHSNLASALLNAGQVAEAIGHAEAALCLKPDFVDARLNLGLALARSGRAAEAQVQFQEALRLDPASGIARQQLEQLRTARPVAR